MEKKEFKIMSAASALKGSTKVNEKQVNKEEEAAKNELKEIANFCKGRLREVAQQNIDKAITAGRSYANICYRVNTYYNSVDAVKKVYKENFVNYLESLGYTADNLTIRYDNEYKLITFKLYFSWGEAEEVEKSTDFSTKLDKLVEDAASSILAELLGL